MILHIPHSSRYIPVDIRDQLTLSDEELSRELTRMTDAFTDELFSLPNAIRIVSPVSRLVLDVERLPDDSEPMAIVGMGMVYTKTADGRPLRRTLTQKEKQRLIAGYYELHHQALYEAVNVEIETVGRSLIVDCHSFPSRPLSCDKDQTMPRPDICIGTDPFHTPKALVGVAESAFRNVGLSVGVDQPYDGTIVPLKYLNHDKRVQSIMVEVNRSLYMEEASGRKIAGFDNIRKRIQDVLGMLDSEPSDDLSLF